jgi:site-specific recombinase
MDRPNPKDAMEPETASPPSHAAPPEAIPGRLPPVREMVLESMPEPRRANRRVRELAGHMDELCSAPDLHERLEAFVRLSRWTRAWSGFGSEAAGRGAQGSPSTYRLRMLMDLLEDAPAVRACYHDAVESILVACRGVDLFATAGIPTDRGFLAELGDRVMEHLLPEPRDDDDLAKLLRTLFHHVFEIDRFLELSQEMQRRAFRLLVPLDRPAAWNRLRADFADAFRLLAARVQATGLAENLRERSRPGPVAESPFFRLARPSDAVLAALETGEGMGEAADRWRSDCARCREALAEIHRQLEAEGVSVAIVFGLEVLERCLLRMEKMVRLMAADGVEDQSDAVFELLGKLILASHQDRSLRHLFSWGTHLLHRKIVERAGKAGEHYIARNFKEYRHIWLAAAGGGVVTVFTAVVKMYLSGLHLPAFQEGFTTGLNYAVSFLILQRFGLILATKQPAMTAATLATIVREERGAERREDIVDFTARICHSQLAAALANILVVSAGAVGFSFLWRQAFGRHFLELKEAAYVVDSLPVLHSGTAIYACLTGVILWLASLAGGWFDNWAAYHRLPRAVAEHPLGAWLGRERMERWGAVVARGASGWGTNISLGFMLGYVHGAGRFLGIPMDVRHVTLNTGTFALAVAGGGQALPLGAFLWALTGIAVMFVCNLGVSFLLSLFTAVRAYSVPRREVVRLLGDMVRAFFRSPGRFVLPPR